MLPNIRPMLLQIVAELIDRHPVEASAQLKPTCVGGFMGPLGRRASRAPNGRTPIEDKPPMPKKTGTNPKGEFALFNVVYEDNSVRSNCRVPNEILAGLKGDEPARGFIMEQDRCDFYI